MNGDPYFYPGTNVLRNKFDIRDAAQLERAERLLVNERLSEPPPAVPINYEGYKALHHHLFQDVYEWAGQPRTVDMARNETPLKLFDLPEQIDRMMFLQFVDLNIEHDLYGLSPRQFSNRAAEHICAINNIHPFREGNGRTQQLFLEVLAKQAGHRFDRALVKREPWNRASKEGFRERYDLMAQVIKSAIRDRRRARDRDSGPDRDRDR